MSIHEEWKELAFTEKDEASTQAFWKEYCDIEKGIYEALLTYRDIKTEGTLKELAERFEVTIVYFMGFLDGINDSLVSPLDLEALTEDTAIELNIDYEKLYYNMLAAQAEWLYTLPQWNEILTEERRREIKKEYSSLKTVVKGEKIGRNDPCTCGSGKKYKKCCGR